MIHLIFDAEETYLFLAQTQITLYKWYQCKATERKMNLNTYVYQYK